MQTQDGINFVVQSGPGLLAVRPPGPAGAPGPLGTLLLGVRLFVFGHVLALALGIWFDFGHLFGHLGTHCECRNAPWFWDGAAFAKDGRKVEAL